MPSFWTNFNQVFYIIPWPLFCLPFIAKRGAGDEVAPCYVFLDCSNYSFLVTCGQFTPVHLLASVIKPLRSNDIFDQNLSAKCEHSLKVRIKEKSTKLAYMGFCNCASQKALKLSEVIHGVTTFKLTIG